MKLPFATRLFLMNACGLLFATIAVPKAFSAAEEEPAVAKNNTRADEHIDSILDRLERRLIDQDRDVLNFGDEVEPPSPKEVPKTKYSYPKRKVTSSTSEQDKLKALSKTITELENQVDKLASNVQKTKQNLLDDAAIDNFVAIEAELADTNLASIKTMTIKLDGYDVYVLNEASGLWMPSKKVPLYAGPLQPGSHRIDVEVRLVMRHKTGMPLNADIYRFVDKSFDVSVPAGTVNNRYVISIKPPTKLGEHADATMKEAI